MSIYFVDSVNGNDSFDGLDAKKAFKTLEKVNSLTLKAGDRVLLKKGCVFEGSIAVTDSGEAYNPIVVASFGSELTKPIINTTDCDYCVLITGQYVTVRDLEMTNPKGKYGVCVNSTIYGAVNDITIADCNIHDIWIKNSINDEDIDIFAGHRYRGGTKGKNYDHAYGAISFETNREKPTWFENARVEGNLIRNVNRTGIWVGGRWQNRFKNSFMWHVNQAPGMDDPWYPHKDIYIGHNFLDHIYGDGIVGTSCQNILIEYNRVFYANYMSRDGGCNVAVWSMNSEGSVIQYNEIAYTGCEFGGDGEALDIDNCSRDTIVQYNYSHDNAGGWLLICNNCNDRNSHRNSIVRNNLSINDATKDDCALVNLTGCMENIYILNNTIYNDNENLYRIFQVANYTQTGPVRDVLFANNILFAKQNTNNYNNFEAHGQFTFDSNIVCNAPKLPESDNIIEKETYNINPVLSGELKVVGSRRETDAFVPRWNSPALRLGKYFEQCADEDYNGISTKGHCYVGAFYYKDANIG